MAFENAVKVRYLDAVENCWYRSFAKDVEINDMNLDAIKKQARNEIINEIKNLDIPIDVRMRGSDTVMDYIIYMLEGKFND